MAINGRGGLRCSPLKWLKSQSVWKCSEHRGNKLFMILQLSQACFMHKYGHKWFLKSYTGLGKDKEARSLGWLPGLLEGAPEPHAREQILWGEDAPRVTVGPQRWSTGRISLILSNDQAEATVLPGSVAPTSAFRPPHRGAHRWAWSGPWTPQETYSQCPQISAQLCKLDAGTLFSWMRKLCVPRYFFLPCLLSVYLS